MPAGLVDAGESPEEAAVRELKEETGYVGVVSESSPVMFNGMSPIFSDHSLTNRSTDPGFCNTNLKMIHVIVDMSLPENQNPKPQLEDSEFIEVFKLPLKDLYTGCKKLEKEGFAIDARVATLAEGIEVAKQWKL